jgi:hypothetical protein
MKRYVTATVSAVSLVLFSGVGAQADPITTAPVTWTYTFTPQMPQHTVYAAQGTSGGVFFTAPQANAAGTATSEVPNNGTASNATQVIVTNLSTFAPTSVLSANQDTLTNSPYSIQMKLFTSAGGNTTAQTITFHGTLSGYFSQDGALITNTWSDPTQSVTMGGYTFTVALDSYSGPGDPTDPQSGSINALVTVSGGNITPVNSNTPEPSTMLLSGLGLTFLGGAAWRKRRRARAAAGV